MRRNSKIDRTRTIRGGFYEQQKPLVRHTLAPLASADSIAHERTPIEEVAPIEGPIDEAALEAELAEYRRTLWDLRDDIRCRMSMGSKQLRRSWYRLEHETMCVVESSREIAPASMKSIMQAIDRLRYFRGLLSAVGLPLRPLPLSA